MDLKQIGKRIREAREKFGITQEELVERLGKKYANDISVYENGKRKISAIDLAEIAKAIGVPVSYFFLDDAFAEDDLETNLLVWFRSLPTLEAKKRVFTFLDQMKPLIVGEDKSTIYKPKSKRKG